MFNLTKEQMGFFKPDWFEYVLIYEDKLIMGETKKDGKKSELILDDKGNVIHKVYGENTEARHYILFGVR